PPTSLIFYPLPTLRVLRSPLFPYTTLFRSHCSLIFRPVAALRKKGAAASWPATKSRRGNSRALAIASRIVERPMLRQSLPIRRRSEEHTSELQSPYDLVCRLLLEKKKRAKI